MKRIFSLLILFVALGVSTLQAQYSRNDNEKETRRYEPGVYQDERGEYRWQVVERRVWIPEYRTPGIFGIGSRTIPGHYEVRSSDRVKVYTRSQYESRQQGRDGKHPHGMPPGQRKKMQKNRGYGDQRWDNDDRDDDNRKKKNKKKDYNKDRDDDRDDDRYDRDDRD